MPSPKYSSSLTPFYLPPSSLLTKQFFRNQLFPSILPGHHLKTSPQLDAPHQFPAGGGAAGAHQPPQLTRPLAISTAALHVGRLRGDVPAEQTANHERNWDNGGERLASKPSAVDADWLVMGKTPALTLGFRGQLSPPPCQCTQL